MRQREVPPPRMVGKGIVGGTCMRCGEYDPQATESDDGLLCSGCVDGETETNLDLSAEILAAEHRTRARR